MIKIADGGRFFGEGLEGLKREGSMKTHSRKNVLSYFLSRLLVFSVVGLTSTVTVAYDDPKIQKNIKVDPPAAYKPFSPQATIAGHCPGDMEENFTIDQVRIHSYTGRSAGGGTNMGIYFTPIGRSLTLVSQIKIPPSEQGITNVVVRDFPPDVFLTVEDFKRMKINIQGSDNWFLGALLIEGLKRGCDPGQAGNWTTLYFNPFVRTWIDQSHPLYLSMDDAVAIFRVQVGDVDSAGTKDSVNVSTPFEGPNPTWDVIFNSGSLYYPQTEGFQRSRIYYHGRTYFAIPQPGMAWEEKRHLGSFSSLSSPSGFIIAIRNHMPSGLLYTDGTDGLYLKWFYGFLIKPIFKNSPKPPFWGYKASRIDFWVDESCGGYLGSGDPCEKRASEPIHMVTSSPVPLSHFGEAPVYTNAAGFLNWATSYDDPGDPGS